MSEGNEDKKDNEDNIPDDELGTIIEISHLLVSLVFERNIQKNIEVNFVKNFCYLLYNWNENYAQNERIEKNCVFVQNWIDNSLSLNELVQTLKTMTAKLEQYTKSDLPTFKLSDHYFNIIKEESENEFYMASSPKGR